MDVQKPAGIFWPPGGGSAAMTNFRDSRRTDPTRMSPGDERGPQGSAAAVEGGKEGGEVVGVGG